MANDDSPVELIGVYNADGGLFGELRYLVGNARGTAHCALCNIAHDSVDAFFARLASTLEVR